jgi:hypothetical protein
VVPIFLTPKKKPAGYTGYIAPDITAGFAMYTVNNSWMVGGMRIGSIPAKGLKVQSWRWYCRSEFILLQGCRQQRRKRI